MEIRGIKKAKIHQVNAGFYEVYFNNKFYTLRGAGKLRANNITPVVGDYVEISEGFVEDVLERKNQLIRPKVANVDYAFVIYSYKEPELSPIMIDTYLAMIEFSNIKPILIFTKSDLTNNFSWKKRYEKLGYQCYNFSINSTKNIENIKKIIKNKVCVFMGQSGVGKTSLINKLTNQDLLTQEISKSLNRGKHTTRVVTLYKYDETEIIDTPGFSNLILNLLPLELSHSYKIFKENAIKCKFSSCLHDIEDIKDCYIKQLVAENIIDEFRYKNYLKLLKESRALKTY
ncbi:putative GTPase engC [Mycoplasmopsis californica]|uniref:Small ribosomal subunit biogenesis GTPase RsgA n=1 Tax=Mycoplasmopsis equigenitalium TaxID=114883 RepID=A0ABY5J4V5_9BACT|nr:ribosome small subunit-dependent GTPase A [Mycoplasmopsis equigenitalium]UUD37162.1 ribosome small subunit-dependent GTPase A [Mycoplasmopsis equigenitalium]VEU69532.1 putative GTPase engC [Mycoplasmopsis californica]